MDEEKIVKCNRCNINSKRSETRIIKGKVYCRFCNSLIGEESEVFGVDDDRHEEPEEILEENSDTPNEIPDADVCEEKEHGDETESTSLEENTEVSE